MQKSPELQRLLTRMIYEHCLRVFIWKEAPRRMRCYNGCIIPYHATYLRVGTLVYCENCGTALEDKLDD